MINWKCMFLGHRWGNWSGMNSQPILLRRCMDCFYEDNKPDQERIDWLTKNSKSLTEFMKELDDKCQKS